MEIATADSYPPRRETLMIEKGWDSVIAIKADNPGVWATHYHNDFHVETGMSMHLVDNPEKLRKNLDTYFLFLRTAAQ